MSTWGRRIVGVLQIAGGATGFLMAVSALLSEPARLNPLYEEVLLCSVGGLSIVAGVLVLESQPQGLFLSKIVQLLSLPVLFSPMLSYQLLSGLTVRAAIGSASGVQTFWANVGLGVVWLPASLLFRRTSCCRDAHYGDFRLRVALQTLAAGANVVRGGECWICATKRGMPCL